MSGNSLLVDTNILIYLFKLPDAIIAATAHYLNIPLITADKEFKTIDDIISVIVDL